MHKMVNRVSIHSRSHSAHIQRAILFVSSTGRQAQSLVVDSTGAGGGRRPLFMLLFARFGTLLFSPSATTFLLPSSSLFFLALSHFLSHPSIPCMSRESRKFTLEGASSNSFPRTSSPPSSESEVDRGGREGLEIYAPRISLLVCPSVLRKSQVVRAYGARIEISRLDICASYFGRANTALLSENLSCHDNTFPRHRVFVISRLWLGIF